MKHVPFCDLVPGQVYLFDQDNDDRASLEPATFLMNENGCMVQFLFDNQVEAAVGRHALELSAELLEMMMTERADEIRRLKAETDVLFNLKRSLK